MRTLGWKQRSTACTNHRILYTRVLQTAKAKEEDAMLTQNLCTEPVGVSEVFSVLPFLYREVVRRV